MAPEVKKTIPPKSKPPVEEVEGEEEEVTPHNSHPAAKSITDIKELQKELIDISFFGIISSMKPDNKHRKDLERLEELLSEVRIGIEKFIFENQLEIAKDVSAEVEEEENPDEDEDGNPKIKISSEKSEKPEPKKQESKDKKLKESFRDLINKTI